MQATGSIGQLRVGYSVAIEFSQWSLTRNSILGVTNIALTATVGRCDDFWSLQTPTSVRLHMGGNSWWVWDSVKYKPTSVTKGTVIDVELMGNPVAVKE